MKAGASPSALARESGVRRRLLHEWKKRVEEGGAENLRDSGRPRTDSGCGAAGSDEVRADLTHMLDEGYKRQRLHSVLGYLSLTEFETIHATPAHNAAANRSLVSLLP